MVSAATRAYAPRMSELCIVNGRDLRASGRAIHNAVARQTAAGEPEGGWLPGERITIEAAIEAYSTGSAHAAFEDHRRGRIAVGLDADLAVLDLDLLADGTSAIIGTTAVATLVGGRIVHRTEGPE